MRTITLLMSIALGASTGCGGGPALGGVPHPNNAAMAGGVAAAAAAIPPADPHAADRRPEQRTEEEKRPVDVKEQVPASTFDHLDSGGNGSGHELVRPHAGDAPPARASDDGITSTPVVTSTRPIPPSKTAPAKTTRPPTLPSPHDAVDPDHADAR